ncbi:MAG TPA: hypothetical protein VJT72_06335 [Pseudonocardiaceae bacterium]|nr:hypothetical protein [Pseudonocardiaceae bacterium]
MIKNGKIERVRFAKIIRKIFFTFVIGGLAYLITSMVSSEQQSQAWGIIVSLFIGACTLVIQFIADFDNRLESVEEKQEKHLTEMRSLVENGFAKMSEATALFRELEASAMQTDAVTRLVRHSTQIDPSSPPLIHGFAQSQVNRTSQFLKELSEGGQIAYDGEDRDWMLDLTIQSRVSIDATSLSTVDAGGISYDDGLWTSEYGQRYLELQRNAIRRGVTVRRIFILDNAKLTISKLATESDFLRIYRRQQDLGIQTRVLEQSTIPHDFKNLLFDFIVFDGVISYEVTPASRVEDTMNPTIVKTNLTLRPERVKERMQRFEALWEAARKIEQLHQNSSAR